MTFFNNNARLDLTCPNCNRKFKARLGDMRGQSLKCPNCGVGYDGTELDKAIRKAESDIKRAFR